MGNGNADFVTKFLFLFVFFLLVVDKMNECVFGIFRNLSMSIIWTNICIINIKMHYNLERHV